MVVDVIELLVHWHAGRPTGLLSSSLGLDPKTVRKYIGRAVEAGIVPGGAPLSREEWSLLVDEWFPAVGDASLRRSSWPVIEPYHDQIEKWLPEVTVATIHQRLRDDQGLSASASSLRRYISANFSEQALRSSVRVLRDAPPAGDEAQVDYGLLGRWFDPVTKKTRRVWGFLMVLCCSRLLFLRPVLKMDQAAWVEAHIAAFEFYAGVPRRVTPDNLKTGVIKPDLYDPLINKAFGELGSFYGFLIDPARAAKPRDKGQVERPVPYARDSFFAGRSGEFTDLYSMQADAVRWSREVANERPCRALEGVAPRVVFEAEERHTLLVLPPSLFELASWSSAKVGPDIHVRAGKALYSVPWAHIGKVVDIRDGLRTVEVYLDGKLVKTHVRIEKGKETDYADYPPEKIAFFMRTPVWCRKRAAELGRFVSELVCSLLEVDVIYRLRSAQGVIRLADKHGAERLDAACRRAIMVGDPSYKTVQGILVAGTENDGEPEQRLSNAPAHLHGPEALFSDGAAS